MTILLLGPDGSGKTTLANRISSDTGYGSFHFTKDSVYGDYLRPLAKLELLYAILDRFVFDELVYAPLMKRKISFTIKQLDNLMLLLLAHNPLVILTTHEPTAEQYSSEKQYLPYEQWSDCLEVYRALLSFHEISCIEYDYSRVRGEDLYSSILAIHEERLSQSEWWVDQWGSNYGMVGSHSPKVLIVAEQLGPYNTNHIPFEAGPTGYMMSELLEKVPYGAIAITNWLKTRGNESNRSLIIEELEHLQPQHVLVMGKTAHAAIPLLKERTIDYEVVDHLGFVNRNRATWSSYKTHVRGILKGWIKKTG